MKPKKIKVKIHCVIETEFFVYDTPNKNYKAKRGIRRWVRETLKNWCSHIPMYVEKDDAGSYIEDCTRNTKIKIK